MPLTDRLGRLSYRQRSGASCSRWAFSTCGLFDREIVERHGGRIWAESTPSEGSTFYFTLRAA